MNTALKVFRWSLGCRFIDFTLNYFGMLFTDGNHLSLFFVWIICLENQAFCCWPLCLLGVCQSTRLGDGCGSICQRREMS